MLSLKQNTKAVANAKSVQPGFINKGNSILQILSVIPTLWNRLSSESNTLSHMLRAIRPHMPLKKH